MDPNRPFGEKKKVQRKRLQHQMKHAYSHNWLQFKKKSLQHNWKVLIVAAANLRIQVMFPYQEKMIGCSS